MENLIPPIFFGQGSVFHSRHFAADTHFQYPTFFVKFKCDGETELQSLLRKKFYGLFSLKASDYLSGKTGTFQKNIRDFLREKCDYDPEEIWLQTMPRMFGYVFNPVSFWLCHRNNTLDAVLCEVNNTFGERHFYWIHTGSEITSKEWMLARKAFHVSPFFPVDGHYQFRFQQEPQFSKTEIFYYNSQNELMLKTWVTGSITPLIDHSFSKIFFKYGWITPLVVLRIHYQALRLWIKKVQFYSKPLRPQKEISSVATLDTGTNVSADSEKG